MGGGGSGNRVLFTLKINRPHENCSLQCFLWEKVRVPIYKCPSDKDTIFESGKVQAFKAALVIYTAWIPRFCPPIRPGMASTTLRMTNCKVQTNKLPQGTVVTGRCLLIGDHCTYMSQLTSCYTGVIITCRQCMSFPTNEVIKFNHNSGGQR